MYGQRIQSVIISDLLASVNFFKTFSTSLYLMLHLISCVRKCLHVRGCLFSYLHCPDVKLCLLAELPGEWQYAVEL